MSDNFDSQFDDEDFEDENQENEDFEEDFEQDEEFEEDFEEDDDFEQEEESFEEDDSEDEEDFDKPVDEGDIVEVEIEDLGSKGDGIARIDGFVIFVPGAEVDQTYDVEVTSVGRKFAFAEIDE